MIKLNCPTESKKQDKDVMETVCSLLQNGSNTERRWTSKMSEMVWLFIQDKEHTVTQTFVLLCALE